jgi:hypothetical protein
MSRDFPGAYYDKWKTTEDDMISEDREAEFHSLVSQLDNANNRIDELLEVLYECEEYFEARGDADHTGVTYIANQEMRILMHIHKLIGKGERA